MALIDHIPSDDAADMPTKHQKLLSKHVPEDGLTLWTAFTDGGSDWEMLKPYPCLGL